MPLTAEQAADIARQHGLSLTDATALRLLADTAAQAHDIAARFTPAVTRETVADSVAAKSAHLAEIRSRTNTNGYQRPLPTPTAPAPPDAPPPAAPPVDLSTLRPGAFPSQPKPTVGEQIAEAEAAGDWRTASHLKATLLAELHRNMEGHQQ